MAKFREMFEAMVDESGARESITRLTTCGRAENVI
jgi:hypothetical protein